MSTLKFQRCASCHTTGDDVSKAIEGIINATIVPKAAIIYKVTVARIRNSGIVVRIRNKAIVSRR